VNTTFVAIIRSGTDLPTYLKYLPSYLFGPLLGAVIAGLVTKYWITPYVPNFEIETQESVKESQSYVQVN
jgi:fructose-specific phosphotransferase system IIC component